MKNNKLLKIGDILLIDVAAKISGGVKFSSFVLDLTGETAQRFTLKEFRFSADEIFWTDWLELTNDNLSSTDFTLVDNNLTVQIRLTRQGTDDTGEVVFNNISFQGNVQPDSFIAPTIEDSIFSDIIGQPELQELERNIFKKLYYRGILPEYVIRAKNSDYGEDKDFSDLWSSVAKFFGLFIRFFKRYEKFSSDYSLLYEYVKQNGLYFNENTITLEELQYLAQNFYDQIRQRGTLMIFNRKGETFPNGSPVVVDGEFIRLLRTRLYDELSYEMIQENNMGWCLGNSSPMWRGTSGSEALNKTKEKTKDFQNLNDFIINNTPGGYYNLSVIENKKCLVVGSNSSTNVRVGLGRINEEQDVADDIYVIDSRLDYEITFSFKINGAITNRSSLEFGVEGFDSRKNKLNDSFLPSGGTTPTEWFLKNNDYIFTNKNSNVWYYARGIIHAYNTQNIPNDKMNLGFGTNLTFNNPFTRYILPKVQLVTNTVNQLAIWDYKIRPLVRGTNIVPLRGATSNNAVSLGFLDSPRLFWMYAKNNNNSLSQTEVAYILNKYLFPYNVNSVLTFISNGDYESDSSTILYDGHL